MFRAILILKQAQNIKNKESSFPSGEMFYVKLSYLNTSGVNSG